MEEIKWGGELMEIKNKETGDLWGYGIYKDGREMWNCEKDHIDEMIDAWNRRTLICDDSCVECKIAREEYDLQTTFFMAILAHKQAGDSLEAIEKEANIEESQRLFETMKADLNSAIRLAMHCDHERTMSIMKKISESKREKEK